MWAKSVRAEILLLSLLLFVSFLLTGCRHHNELSVGETVNESIVEETAGAIRVSGSCEWVDSGVDLSRGEAVTITATGTVVVRPSALLARRSVRQVGPNGTYLYDDDVISRSFPLPSAERGPAPPYSLIGRIGDGAPFYVGAKKSWLANGTGRLQLQINDFDLSDNNGEFLVQITKPEQPQPVAIEERIVGDVAHGSPKPGCSLVVFYVDGLRPDVVREMAAMGHLPTINRLFLKGGTWVENTFTVFPSDTITSNGTMWTGCFSDRHGLKGQVRFSRRHLRSKSYLEPLGPSRSANLMAPQGIDRLVHQSQTAGVGLLHGKKAAKEWSGTHKTGVPPLFQHLRNTGSDWATGILPMMTEVPPTLWTRSLVKNLPYFRMHEAWKHIDDANTDYTLRYLLDREKPVTIVWLPETDSTSHKRSRGQFGMTRRTIAQADRLIGRIVRDLGAKKRLHKTYFMLVSDHGHHGGRTSHLSSFDIANELFYRPRERTADGKWVGGGLGMSVRQHRSWNRHSEDPSNAFVFLDADSDGAARIFLPRQHFRSGDWIGKRRAADYLQYRLAKNVPPVNLIETLTTWKAMNGGGHLQHPVDLVLMKLSDQSVLISTNDRGQVVIDRRCNAAGEWVYRYRPVTNVRPVCGAEKCGDTQRGDSQYGGVAFDVLLQPTVDPLGLLPVLSADELLGYHDEQFWLRRTSTTNYPDSVVALTRHLLWQKTLRHRETEFAPDIVVTARHGWYFGAKNSPGTMHGYPFKESMRATFFVSGPNIRRGTRLSIPHRMADLTPTILEMVGRTTGDEQFDGRPIREIYCCESASSCAREKPAGKTGSVILRAGQFSSVQTTPSSTTPLPIPPLPTPSSPTRQPQNMLRSEPVYWDELDLHAWHPLRYQPVKPSSYRPFSINRPDSPFDVNNVAYNVLTVLDLNIFRLADDVVVPFRRKETVALEATVDALEREFRRNGRDWIAQGAQVLNISGTVLGDYSPTSTGNLKRVDGTIDWVQQRGKNLEHRIARRVGRQRSSRASNWLHFGIDQTQDVFWETYRFGHRVFAEILDEMILNSVENGADHLMNQFRQRHPAEIIVPMR